MAVNRVENSTAEAAAASKPAEAAGKGGGLKTWLPLIAVIVAMPLMAYATTMFLLVPQLKKALGTGGSAPHAEEHASSGSHGEEAKGGHGEKGKDDGKPKQTYQLSKVLVNVSGSLGTRYLLGTYTLVGNSTEFKTKIEGSKDQLQDLAAGVMSSKTISDLEKPGARNLIRNELISVFNNALGGNVVKEIYITEFAIQ